MTDSEDQELAMIWVKADMDMDGTYRLVVEYNPDVAVTFDQAGAIAYATELYTAAANAAYDAAVVAQMTKKLGSTIEAAVDVITSLRNDRPPLNEMALRPIRIETGVSAQNRTPFLNCTLVGHSLKWRWTPEDAVQHATHVLQSYPNAHLDNAYRRYLVGTIGIDLPRAINAVEDLVNWRHK